MKKYVFALMAFVSATAAAQGKFDTQNFDGFTVHVYQPADSETDGSLIIESRSGLVIVGESKDAVFQDYLGRFTKPVVQTVTNDMPLGTTQNWNGVEIAFRMSTYGTSKADVMIGRSLLLTKGLTLKAHANDKVISKPEDIDAQLNNANILLHTGCSKFVDEKGHISDTSLPRFLQKYYSTMKKAYKKATGAESFVNAMQKAYPGLDGEDDLKQVAQQLFKN